jgi:hypothetical protein
LASASSLPSSSSSSFITSPHWLHFFHDFPRVALRSEASQRFLRTVGCKQLQADFQLARLLEVEASAPAPRGGGSSAGKKYLFVAEWRHKGQRNSSVTSADDHSNDCVALKAANGMYCSVEQKDGSLSLAYAYCSPVVVCFVCACI